MAGHMAQCTIAPWLIDSDVNVKLKCLMVLCTVRFKCEANIMQTVIHPTWKGQSISLSSRFMPSLLASAWHQIRVRVLFDATSPTSTRRFKLILSKFGTYGIRLLGFVPR